MKTHDTREPCPGRVEAIEAMASGMQNDPALREHLLECPACNGYFRRQRRLDELLNNTAGALEDPWLAARPRERRLSPWRIAAVSTSLAAMLAIVVAVVAIAGSRGGNDEDASPAPTMAGAESPAIDGAAPLEGVTAVIDVEPAVVLEETRLTTTGGEQVVRSFEGGLRLSLSGEGDAVVQRTAKRSYRIKLQSGLLVGDVPDTEPRTRVTVSAENMIVKVKGTLFSVRAVDGRITSVDVERGQVLVQSKVSGESRLVNAAERLAVESLALDDRPPDSPSMLMSFLVEIPVEDEDIEVVGPSKTPATLPHIKHAVEEPEPDKEPTLYEKAVALRKDGKYEEAVDTFLAAAAVSTGLTKQRCFYQAASLSLSKLGDPAKTISLCDSYASQFPQGFFIQDVIMLEARAHLRAKEPEKARAVLVDYIASYPDGSQQSLAHLLLGKIFATTYGNCKAAKSHLLYVVQSEPKSARATQAKKILDYCNP